MNIDIKSIAIQTIKTEAAAIEKNLVTIEEQSRDLLRAAVQKNNVSADAGLLIDAALFQNDEQLFRDNIASLQRVIADTGIVLKVIVYNTGNFKPLDGVSMYAEDSGFMPEVESLRGSVGCVAESVPEDFAVGENRDFIPALPQSFKQTVVQNGEKYAVADITLGIIAVRYFLLATATDRAHELEIIGNEPVVQYITRDVYVEMTGQKSRLAA